MLLMLTSLTASSKPLDLTGAKVESVRERRRSGTRGNEVRESDKGE